MIEIFAVIAWIIGLILAVMWLFLPWLILSKLDEVIRELKRMNESRPT